MSESGQFGVVITLSLPQVEPAVVALTRALQQLGDRMADALQPIRDSLDSLRTMLRDELATLNTTLDTELQQIHDALAAGGSDPVPVADVVDYIEQFKANFKGDLDTLGARIGGIIPDVPPEPTPQPEPMP